MTNNTIPSFPNDLNLIRTIAKEAYIYGFPMVDSYRILHAYCVERSNPEYKAPWNQLCNIARVYTPQDSAVQTPNSDTPYSMVGLDLRTEPLVLTVPAIEKTRYFSIQLIDAYTYNFDYIGSRSTGNAGGNFLIAGPHWQGPTPNNVTKVIRAETELALAIYRTQLFNPDDLENVKKIQAGYRVQTLSAFLGQPAPQAAPTIDFIQPLTPVTQKTALEFFNILNFILQFCPPPPSEQELLARFAQIGIGAGLTMPVNALPLTIKTALQQGITDAWVTFASVKQRLDTQEISSGDVFGTRAYLQNNYLYRMLAAVLGIYGNSKQEALYPIYTVDADGQKLDGNQAYILRFAAGQLPPVHAFWSLTMYDQATSLLVANPLHRYLLNSPMLPQLKRDPDGSLSLLIQHAAPLPAQIQNWLPAPAGPFFMVLRLYWPTAEVLDGNWHPPFLERVK